MDSFILSTRIIFRPLNSLLHDFNLVVILLWFSPFLEGPRTLLFFGPGGAAYKFRPEWTIFSLWFENSTAEIVSISYIYDFISIFQIILLILFIRFLHHPPRKDHEWERKHNGFTWDDFWNVMDHNQRVKAMIPMRSRLKKVCEKFPNGVSTTSSGFVMIDLVCLRFWSTFILLYVYSGLLYCCLFVLFPGYKIRPRNSFWYKNRRGEKKRQPDARNGHEQLNKWRRDDRRPRQQKNQN